MAGGRFCAECGQAFQHQNRLRDIAREWLRAVFGTEGILWSTLALLLIAPGKLTREWWAGRRTLRMSPVRVIFVVMLLGTLLTWIQRSLYGVDTFSVLIPLFTYQLAIVATIVTTLLLPHLLPASLRRSTYETATFALYEASFVAIINWLVFLCVMLTAVELPIGLSLFITQYIAPAMILVLGMVVITHGVVHLKTAYGLSSVGAFVRFGILSVGIGLVFMIASAVMKTSGFHPLAQADEELPTFRRVQPVPGS